MLSEAFFHFGSVCKLCVVSLKCCEDQNPTHSFLQRLEFRELIEQHLTDSRGKNTELPLADLLRQSVYSRMAGYEDVNDAERLAHNPMFRLIGSEKICERAAR